MFNGYLIKFSWQSCHFTTVPKDFQEIFHLIFLFLFLFLSHLCVDHVATSLSEKSKTRCLWTSSNTLLIADQLLFTFPGYSNPLATQVLFQLIVQLENQLKGKQQKRKNW